LLASSSGICPFVPYTFANAAMVLSLKGQENCAQCVNLKKNNLYMPTIQGQYGSETVTQYTDRTVEDVLPEDFGMSPLEYLIDRLLAKWDMTVEQLANELLGMGRAEGKDWVEDSCKDALVEEGYNWR